MTKDLQNIIKKIVNLEILDFKEMKKAFSLIMEGKASKVEIAGFLIALKMRGETKTDIAAGASVLREKAFSISVPEDTVDIVGTGGDGIGTYNISTASAFVLAGCGIPVAKHGNKAVSSKSGAADVLSSLGINIECSVDALYESIKKANIVFLMAPRHHSAMKYVGPIRAELGIRTIFNLLGPLSNPSLVNKIMIGVYDQHWLQPFAEALKQLGTTKAWIVHGHSNLDELSTTGVNKICSLDNGQIKKFSLHPSELGIPKTKLKNLIGGNANSNAKSILDLFNNKNSYFKDIVLLNASAALVATGHEKNLQDALKRSEISIKDGKAMEALEKLIHITNL